MTDAWPGSLPTKFQSDGYEHSFPDGRLISRMDVGPSKVRTRSSAAIEPMQGVMLMTTAEKAILKEFVETTLDGGSLPFTFPDPDGGSDILVRFGESLPTTSPSSHDTWAVSLDLEVLPQ